MQQAPYVISPNIIVSHSAKFSKISEINNENIKSPSGNCNAINGFFLFFSFDISLIFFIDLYISKL